MRPGGGRGHTWRLVESTPFTLYGSNKELLSFFGHLDSGVISTVLEVG